MDVCNPAIEQRLKQLLDLPFLPRLLMSTLYERLFVPLSG